MQEIIDWIHKQGYSPKEKIIIDGTVHRFTDATHTRDNVGYCFSEFGGWMHDHKIAETFIWSANKALVDSKQLKLRKKEQARLNKELNAIKQRALEEAESLWDNAPPADPKHPYLVRKRIQPWHARQSDNLLLIPALSPAGLKSIQTIDEEGNKLFYKNCSIKDGYSLIEGNRDKVIICEGFATGATIREATGNAVVLAFFASNLQGVAKIIAKEFPESEIIIAADNDQWGDKNAGVTFANKCKNCTIRPVQFADDIEGKPTDYNDLYLLSGLESVKNQIFPVPAVTSKNIFAASDEDEVPQTTEWQAKFRVLGFDDGHYYYYPDSTQQIVVLSAASHTFNNLLRIAPYSYWTANFKNSKIEEMADFLIQQAHKKGIFSPERQLRGRGIWMDNGSVLFNNGANLYVNRTHKLPLNKWESKFIYERALEIDTPLEPCKNSEALILKDICEMAAWKNKVSGTLLAGWCVVAMASSALPWRPHIWLTGEGGSGKTTVLKEIVGNILGDLMLRIDGGTTEAAIRQVLGNDACPIIYDEAESEGEKDKVTMEGVMMLARKASSGAALIKGGQDGNPTYYYCKSAFCFSCINPEIKRFADERRVILLELQKSSDEGRYQDFLNQIRTHLTPEFRRKLLGRIIDNLPTLLKNCQIFTDAATRILGDRAAADQIGSILAGVYLLYSIGEVDYARATEYIKEHDLRQYTVVDELSDAYQLLSYICSRKIRISNLHEHTIGQLIVNSYTKTFLETEHAVDALRLYGIWPREDGIWVANNSPSLRDLMKGSPWSGWRGLSRIPGCTPHRAGVKYAAGMSGCRGVILPKSYFLEDETKTEGE